MPALVAPTRAAVDAFHAAGLAAGGSDEGAPGLQPLWRTSFYACYLRDPDGNKLSAVCEADRPWLSPPAVDPRVSPSGRWLRSKSRAAQVFAAAHRAARPVPAG
jgi:hypothetical protein